MTFVSFNINGLRAHFHQLEAIIDQFHPDVIGLQETKVHDYMFPLKELSRYGYHVYYHGQKNHYGVAFLCCDQPLVIRRGFSTDSAEAPRRIIMADFMTAYGVLTVVNGYFPQGENRDHPVKFLAKQRFYQDLQNYVEQNHRSNTMLLIMGDMNISPTDLDIGIGEESRKRWLRTGKCSFLPEERKWIACLLNWGLVDIYRHAHPQGEQRYSWFDYRSSSFDKNRGLRIDLLLASCTLTARFCATGIDYDIRAMEKPSDHAPVWAVFDL
ncbi:MAG: exodeoxyribonuclease III [Sodalis sp. Ffu]|nr:MAG: exodeoxyribonuclease III [Sodalis sp. Ffu]